MKLCAFADEASSTLKGQIEALKRNNIEMLEIRGVDGENIKQISYEKIKHIKKELDNSNIKVWSIGSPIGKYNVDDNFKGQLEEFKRLCEFADILGAKRIRFFSFFSKNEDDVFENLQKFVDEAPENIILCHENEKGIFGDDYESCVKIHKQFPRIKAVFDPANFVQCDVDTLEAWEALKEYVDYMHIKDALKNKIVVRAGYGDGNLEKIIVDYAKRGGEVLTLEPHLMEFQGFSALENGESISHLKVYDDTNTAFDDATSALLEILKRNSLI